MPPRYRTKGCSRYSGTKSRSSNSYLWPEGRNPRVGTPSGGIRENSESVKCRFSKCRFSVSNLKFDFISDGGCTREKQIQKALGSLLPCGNRCRFSESAICSSRVHPPSEIKSDFKFKTLRWRPLRWRLTLSEKRGLLEASEWPTLFSRSVENGHPSPRPLKSVPRGPESLSGALRGLWEGVSETPNY